MLIYACLCLSVVYQAVTDGPDEPDKAAAQKILGDR